MAKESETTKQDKKVKRQKGFEPIVRFCLKSQGFSECSLGVWLLCLML